MESIIFIENNKLRISSSTKLIKNESYTFISEAQDVMAKINKKAKQILRSARQDAVRMRKLAKEAYATEKKRGYEEGLQKIRKEMATEINATAINIERYLNDIDDKITTLVMDTVKKVIDSTDKSELISALVKKALTVMRNHKQIKLKISPMHVDFLNARIMEILNAYPNIDGIEIVADNRLSSKQLVLESPIGIVDAGIETQLSAIQDAFTRCLSS